MQIKRGFYFLCPHFCLLKIKQPPKAVSSPARLAISHTAGRCDSSQGNRRHSYRSIHSECDSQRLLLSSIRLFIQGRVLVGINKGHKVTWNSHIILYDSKTRFFFYIKYWRKMTILIFKSSYVIRNIKVSFSPDQWSSASLKIWFWWMFIKINEGALIYRSTYCNKHNYQQMSVFAHICDFQWLVI